MTASRALELANRLAFCSAGLSLIVLPVGTAPFEILFAVSLAACAAGMVLSRSQPAPRWWPGALTLIVAAFVSSLLALDPSRSLRLWAKLLYLLLALPVLRLRARPDRIAMVFVVFAGVVALHSLVAMAAWLRWGGEVRTEIDYLQLAQMAVMALALVVPIAADHGMNRGLRLAACVCALVLATHCVLSGSRAALLCVGILALAELLRRSRRAALLLPLLFYLVYWGLPESRRERIRDALVVEDADQDPPSSLRMRLDMARTGFKIAVDRPAFGVGLDGVRLVYDAYKVGSLRDDPPASQGRRHRKWSNLHDDYVQIAAELGFVGLAAYLWFVALVLRGPPAAASDMASLARGARLAIWLYLVGGLFYKCFLNFYPWRIFVLLVAFDDALRRHRS